MSPSQTPRPIVVGLGELLWDLFPKGKQLGGAPANFAYITALLGDSGIVASRVGDDRLGQEALWHLKSSGLDASRISAAISFVILRATQRFSSSITRNFRDSLMSCDVRSRAPNVPTFSPPGGSAANLEFVLFASLAARRAAH